MIIKQKSLIVALVSSFVIILVLVLTLIGYLAYIELKGEELKRSYQELLQKANAKIYSKNLEVSKLTVKIEKTGALKGKPIIEGVIKNKGPKKITNLLINVKFLDKDSAVIYEESFRPQEPSLGATSLSMVSIPYLYTQTKVILKPNDSLAFKKILANCPSEIVMVLREGEPSSKSSVRWMGKLVHEIASVAFEPH